MKANRLMTAILIVTLVATAMPATARASTDPVNENGEGELHARPLPARPMAAMLQAPPATHFTRAMAQVQTPGPVTRIPGGHFSAKALLITGIVVTTLVVILVLTVPRT